MSWLCVPLKLIGISLVVVLLCGCRVTSIPSGGSYKSAVAQTTLRLAMRSSLHKVELPQVKDKTVSFTTVGFDGDQSDVREYLRVLGRAMIHANGGRLQDKDAEVDVRLIVNTCGVDSDNSFFVPIWWASEENAVVTMDLVIGEHGGKLFPEKHLQGRAKYIESRWFFLIITPGSYQVRRDGAWVPVTDVWSNWKGMFEMPFGIEAGTSTGDAASSE